MTPQSRQRYLDILGVKSDATMDEIHTAYYLLIEQYTHNPTENDVEERGKLQHAYNILCRSYEEPESKVPGEESERHPRLVLKISAALLIVAVPALVAMNFSALKVRMAEIDPGTVVRLNNSSDPYGTILRYDGRHRFHTGDPTPAYQVRVEETGETVWISKRVVVKGMTATGTADQDRKAP